MKKGSILLALACAVLLGAAVVGADASGTGAAKKRCHFVKKKVHGKIKRVRVCPKPKPKPAAKPVNVSLSLDSGHAASAVVGAAGAAIEVHTAAGAQLTLTLPAGALDDDTSITVTPVSRLGGLPDKLKFVSGVQFGPNGLALAKPATLVITGKVGASGVAWFDDGRDVYRHPFTRTASGAEFTVAHFSGVGTVDGPSSSLPDARHELTIEFARYVLPLIRQAETNDALIDEAFSRAYAWERSAALLGLLDEFSAFRGEMQRSLEKALANAVQRADEKCKNHDLTQLNRLLRLERNAQLLGVELPGPSPFDRFVSCAHFELDLSFDASTVKITDIGPSHTEERSSLRVNAQRIPIAPGEDFQITGEGPLNLEKWQYREDVTVTGGGRTFSCSRDGLPGYVSDPVRARLKFGAAAGGALPVTLSLDPGDVVTPVGAGCNLEPYEPAFYRQAYWDYLYASQKTGEGRYVITFTASGALSHFGPENRHLELQAEYGPVTVDGSLDIVLRHVPQP